MQHARQPHVLHIGLAAGELGGECRRAACRGPWCDTARGLRARRVRHGVDMQRELRGERAISQPPAVRRDDMPVAAGRQRGRFQPPLRRRRARQQHADIGGGIGDRGPAVLHRMAAGRQPPRRAWRPVSAVTKMMGAGRHVQLPPPRPGSARCGCPDPAPPCRKRPSPARPAQCGSTHPARAWS